VVFGQQFSGQLRSSESWLVGTSSPRSNAAANSVSRSAMVLPSDRLLLRTPRLDSSERLRARVDFRRFFNNFEFIFATLGGNDREEKYSSGCGHPKQTDRRD
jgi:hypothetical protein